VTAEGQHKPAVPAGRFRDRVPNRLALAFSLAVGFGHSDQFSTALGTGLRMSLDLSQTCRPP